MLILRKIQIHIELYRVTMKIVAKCRIIQNPADPQERIYQNTSEYNGTRENRAQTDRYEAWELTRPHEYETQFRQNIILNKRLMSF